MTWFLVDCNKLQLADQAQTYDKVRSSCLQIKTKLNLVFLARCRSRHTKAVSEMAATDTATTVAKCVAKDVLHLNALWRGHLAAAVAGAADSNMA